jgi:hypothetical protein
VGRDISAWSDLPSTRLQRDGASVVGFAFRISAITCERKLYRKENDLDYITTACLHRKKSPKQSRWKVVSQLVSKLCRQLLPRTQYIQNILFSMEFLLISTVLPIQSSLSVTEVEKIGDLMKSFIFISRHHNRSPSRFFSTIRSEYNPRSQFLTTILPIKYSTNLTSPLCSKKFHFRYAN